MKKLTLSIVAVMAMSTFAIAGGDIAPVEEPMVEVVEPVVSDSGFYLGLGYSFMQDERLWLIDEGWKAEGDWNAVMLQAGYKFNQYIAVEGRYWLTMGDPDITNNWGEDSTWFNEHTELDAWGIYVKPMYPVTDAFDVYALLGYAQSELKASEPGFTAVAVDDGAFSWGLGAAYSFTDSLSVFVDYVVLYDDTVLPVRSDDAVMANNEIKIDTINFGVTYKF